MIESGEKPAKIAEILGYSEKTIRREIKRGMVIQKKKPEDVRKSTMHIHTAVGKEEAMKTETEFCGGLFQRNRHR